MAPLLPATQRAFSVLRDPSNVQVNMQVPFLDLRAQHAPLMTELLDAFRQVTEASAFAGGPFVARFESEFAAFCRTQHALGVGSGTDALWLSLLALGVGPGDEVITVPNSFMATAEAISLCGARPVFVDIDEQTYTMDPAQLEAAITLRTQAIVPYTFSARWQTWIASWPSRSGTALLWWRMPARRTVRNTKEGWRAA